jgi:hypothetical protein
MSDEDVNYWRNRIREMLRRVPAKVNAGGIQTAQAYKEAVAFANRHLNSGRTNLAHLKTAVSRLAVYEN